MIETDLQFHPMRCAADADAFRTLNEEWIQRHFSLEEKDERTLNDPEGQIVAKGGQVYVAELDGERVAAVALLAYGEGDFELSKMAVSPSMRGKGIGRRLILYTLRAGKAAGGATRVSWQQ